MTTTQTLLVATCGQGILRSTDKGGSWNRLSIFQDIEYDDIVRTLAIHPKDPSTIYAGFQCGVAKSTDAGQTWHRLSSFLNNYAIWKLVVDPKNPDNIYVGTGAPTRAFAARSKDGGRTFERLSLSFPEHCAGVSKPRLLAMAIDPEQPNNIWAGVEEGGLYHSNNHGETWRRVDTEIQGQEIMNSDIHDVVVVPGPPKRIVVSTVQTIHISENNGKTWHCINAKKRFGHRYSRNVATIHDKKGTLLHAVSDSTPGTIGLVHRSTDGGKNWKPVDLETKPKSCPWAFGLNPANPNHILMGTKFGELYESNDAGQTFKKHWREFSEICAVAWVPV
jgi:photosystem II stability/assembly factor-like uncharacterized protein